MKDKSYQYLENDFFEMCQIRKIKRIPMLLYIYLRGLYCRFQKPDFFYFDKDVKRHLGISQSTLSRARDYLQERGLIKYISGKGINPSTYLMLGTSLLPITKKPIGYRQTHAYGCRQNDDTYYKSKERVKNKNNEDSTWQKDALKVIKAKNELKLKQLEAKSDNFRLQKRFGKYFAEKGAS